MRTPPYVAAISSDVRVHHVTAALRKALRRAGIPVAQFSPFRSLRLEFDSNGGPPLENRSLHSLIRALVGCEVAFLEDYKQGWAPADIVRDLQARGIVPTAVRIIAWSAPGTFSVRLETPHGGEPSSQ